MSVTPVQPKTPFTSSATETMLTTEATPKSLTDEASPFFTPTDTTPSTPESPITTQKSPPQEKKRIDFTKVKPVALAALGTLVVIGAAHLIHSNFTFSNTAIS